MKVRLLALTTTALLLTGCALGPDFVAPEKPQQQWHTELPHGGKLANLDKWWQQLNDPLLSELIDDTEKNSPTLDMALAKMNEARANATIGGAGLYPSLNLSAAANQSRSAFGIQIIDQQVNKTGLDASWEIDLFGKNRRTAQSARARLGAGEAGWNDARVSLAAEVAEVYVELRQCESELENAGLSKKSRMTMQEITRIKAGSGLASALDEARAQASEADADSAYVAKQGECARTLNRLTALTGIEHDTLQARLAAQRGIVPVPNSVDISSVAAQVLRQRPDVAVAEWNLAAASADIGASKAAMYPSLTLTGSVANNLVYMNGQSALVPTWSYGPSLSLPLFAGGRVSAGVKAAQARYDYALANYKKTVRDAVREVEDALVRLNVANTRAHDADQSQQKFQQLFRASEARFNVGLENRATLEDAWRGWLQAQDAATALKRETDSAWIALYKALGGGWDWDQRSPSVADSAQAH